MADANSTNPTREVRIAQHIKITEMKHAPVVEIWRPVPDRKMWRVA
jgi:hypothetical protein